MTGIDAGKPAPRRALGWLLVSTLTLILVSPAAPAEAQASAVARLLVSASSSRAAVSSGSAVLRSGSVAGARATTLSQEILLQRALTSSMLGAAGLAGTVDPSYGESYADSIFADLYEEVHGNEDPVLEYLRSEGFP